MLLEVFHHANLHCRFSNLFSAIENEISAKGALGISSYGVSMTTLEEIFLHLGEEEEAAKEVEALEVMQGKKRGVSKHTNTQNDTLKH